MSVAATPSGAVPECGNTVCLLQASIVKVPSGKRRRAESGRFDRTVVQFCGEGGSSTPPTADREAAAHQRRTGADSLPAAAARAARRGTASCEGRLSRLEPYEAKVSRTVLRGGHGRQRPGPTRPPFAKVTSMTKDTALRCLVTVAALGAALAHVLLPALVPDAITAAFLLLALLPWLAPLIKSVDVPGVGKIELREIERKAEEAIGAALSAEKKADVALATGLSSPAEVRTPAPLKHAELDALATEYNEIRKSQRAGPARTSAMSTVVRKMMTAAAELAPDEIAKALGEKDGGKRLVAYAALHAHPRPELLEALIRAVEAEDTAFGQYWGIQAIGRVLGTLDQNQISMKTVNGLRELLKRFKPGTDRYYELSRILKGLKPA